MWVPSDPHRGSKSFGHDSHCTLSQVLPTDKRSLAVQRIDDRTAVARAIAKIEQDVEFVPELRHVVDSGLELGSLGRHQLRIRADRDSFDVMAVSVGSHDILVDRFLDYTRVCRHHYSPIVASSPSQRGA